MTDPAEPNRRVLLVRRPQGVPQPSDFELDSAGLAPLAEGQFRVRNHFLSVDPAQRGWASSGANYASPVPLGSVMRALAVGEVVETSNPDFPVGVHAYGWFGWQLLATAEPRDVLTRFARPELPLSVYAGVLGINGLTARLALQGLGRPRPGETVLVSTAAGAVGSIVGQLARMEGCRTIGLTGSDAKIALCVDRFGYDRALNYKSGSMPELLRTAAPDGIDIYFDNVGGDTLDLVIRAMRTGGRIIQCGTASISSWSPAPTGPRNERELLTRRLSWNGFVIFDHVQQFADTLIWLTARVKAGLAYEEDIRTSIDFAPYALQQLYAGENRGKLLIQVV